MPKPLRPKLGKYIGILRWFFRLELSGYILPVKAMSIGTSYCFLYRVPCQAVNMPRPRNTICIYYMYIFILQQKSLNNACQYYKQTVFNYWFLLATLQQYLLWAANFNSIYMYICILSVQEVVAHLYGNILHKIGNYFLDTQSVERVLALLE